MNESVIKYQSDALSMLRSVYDYGTGRFEWNEDNFDWDKFNNLIHSIGQSRQNALELIHRDISSNDLFKKILAIKVAGDVMNPVESEDEEEARGIINALTELSKQESMPELLEAIADSLGYPYLPEAKDALLDLSYHQDKYVRLAATMSLGSLTVEDDADVRSRLLQLSNDSDDEVADWANFNLEPID